jgi:two-component system, OmpR family, sensor kinase
VPIRWRLTLFIALAIGAILLILGVALFFLLRNALLSNVENTTRQRAENAAGSIREGAPLDREDTEELSLDGVFVIARDERGRVLTETVDLPKGGGGDTVWRRALDTGEPASGTALFSGEEPTYVYAVPVDPAHRRARVVEAGKSCEAA